MATRIEIVGADELRTRLVQIDERLRGPLRPVLEPIGRAMLEAAREAITTAGRGAWPPLAESTLEIRERKGQGGSPLRAGGTLFDSLQQLELADDRVEVGTREPRARIQEYGGTTPAGSAIPGKRVPPRPFMVIPEPTIDLAIGSLLDHLFGREGANA